MAHDVSLWWATRTKADRDRWLGLLFIFLVALIWVIASFVVQDIEAAGLDPFVLSYIANSLFVVYLPLHYGNFRRKQRHHRGKSYGAPHSSPRLLQHGHGSLSAEESQALVCPPAAEGPAEDVGDSAAPGCGTKPSSWIDVQSLKAAAVVAPLWFSAQYTFNSSLSRTTVTSNTILSSTSSLFTFLLSIALLREPFRPIKLLSILLCMAGACFLPAVLAVVQQGQQPNAGTAVVTLSDRSNASGSQSVTGDFMVLTSAAFYACYTIAIKKMLPEDESASMMLFFGLIGLLNATVLAPVLAGLALTGVISLAALSLKMFFITVLKGLFDNVLSDYMWARAVLLVGPTIATVGLSIQVPLAVLADLVLKSPPWLHSPAAAATTLLGAGLALAGFLGINVDFAPTVPRAAAAVAVAAAHGAGDDSAECGARAVVSGSQ